MIFRNLSSYIDALQARRDLVVVETEVDPHLELAEIHRRVIAAGGPALLFTKVKGKRFPVATNLYGSRARVDLAFGPRPLEFIKKVASLPHELLPPSLGKIWGLRSMALPALKIGMKTVQEAPVLRHTLKDLTEIPAITSWAEDGGPFITLPLVHTQGLGGKEKPDNLGMYRIQIHDARETGMHFQIGKGGGYHLWEAEQKNQALPLNIYVGGPPALTLAAIAPLPENVPELMLASLVLGERLTRASWKGASPSPVAEAEFCLVGEVPPHVRRPEGPFGDHYGYYSLKHDYPVFRPSAIYHREEAIYPATVVGKPRQEDFFLGDYLTELLSPLFPLVMPAVTDLWSYGETGYHALAAAVLKERFGRESMSSAFRILGEGQLALTKFLIGLDKPMNLRDFRKVLTHVLARVEWEKDLFIFSDVAMDTLDYAGPQVNHGSKGVLMGLGEPRRELPHEWRGALPSALARKAVAFSPGCLVVEVPPYEQDKDVVQRLIAEKALDQWPLIVAVDDATKATRSEASFLWTAFTRFEPAADIHARKTTVVRNKINFTGPVAIDARMKPWYPKELFCDPQTAATVTRRWKEYFPAGGVEMGDSDLAHL